SWAAAATGGESPIDLGAAAFKDLEEVREHVATAGHTWADVGPFAMGDESLVVAVEPAPRYRGDTEAALADLQTWQQAGHAVLLTVPGPGQAQRTVEWLAEHDVAARHVEVLEPGAGSSERIVQVAVADLDEGFIAADLGFVVLTYDD
ncbi:transcription-repair coupling factor, partial [Aeromicrobium phragmitis]